MSADDTQEPIVYTVEDVARILKVDEQTVRKLIADGELRYKRVGRQYRITKEMLQEYLDKPEII
jgi:excisionase family DNA binding protein